jgi:hypothetical protein
VPNRQQFDMMFAMAKKQDAGYRSVTNPASDWMKLNCGDRAVYRRNADGRLSLIAPAEGVSADVEVPGSNPNDPEFNEQFVAAEQMDAMDAALADIQVPSLQQHGTAVGQRLGAAGFGATGSSHPQQQQQLLQPEPQPEPEPEHHSARHEWNVLHTKGVSHHSDVGLVVRTQRLRALSLARSLTCSLRSVSGATTGWCRLRRMVNRDA